MCQYALYIIVDDSVMYKEWNCKLFFWNLRGMEFMKSRKSHSSIRIDRLHHPDLFKHTALLSNLIN